MIRSRGGRLFDPDVFLFLQGRKTKEDKARVLRISDNCILNALEGLLSLKGDRLSYKALDVEQIGSVYETVMGFRVERATGPMLAIKAGKNADAVAVYDEMKGQQREGHKEYRIKKAGAPPGGN